MLHPNAFSLRAFIVSISLLVITIFSTEIFALPTHTLTRGEWSLISIPADPGPNGTVETLFADDLPAASYGSSGEWLIYEFNASSNAYREVELSDNLLANTGYWMIQISADSVVLDLPDSLRPLTGESTTDCPTRDLCSIKLLIGKQGGQWNLVGVSRDTSLDFSETHFQSDSTACATSCTPAEAMSAALIGTTLHRYKSGSYEALSSSSVFDPWDGLWMYVIADPASPTWLLPTKNPELTCTTNGGKAGDYGLKTWCWRDVPLPINAGKSASFSNTELSIDSECNENQITNVGNELRFYLDSRTPPQDWCNNAFNMRAEIFTRPWPVNNPIGTEEWFGWTYRFGDNYVPDTENPWAFFQVHHGVAGSPPFALFVVPSSLYGAQNGEIVVVNHANETETDRTRTGVITKPGMSLNMVVHVVHQLGDKGLLQVWINDNLVYDKQVSTVYDFEPLGGNAKFGIYKWPWREASGIQSSLDQGIDHLESYMGPLRIITRMPWDENYGVNSYADVDPKQ